MCMSTLAMSVSGGQAVSAWAALESAAKNKRLHIAKSRMITPRKAPSTRHRIGCNRLALTPDRFASARKPKLRPFFRDGPDDLVVHPDQAAPFALGFGRQFV